jgi:hypothetical protein
VEVAAAEARAAQLILTFVMEVLVVMVLMEIHQHSEM